MPARLCAYFNTTQTSVNRDFHQPIQNASQCFVQAIKFKTMMFGIIACTGILFSSCNPDDDSSTDGTSGATSQNSFSMPNQPRTAHSNAVRNYLFLG